MQNISIKILIVVVVFPTLIFAQSGSDDYQYDPNGNLIMDQYKEITNIEYNVLNLPEKILFDDGRKIVYRYAADGKKLTQETILQDGNPDNKKDYLDNVVYSSGQLEYINTSEGYVEPQNNQFSYTYQHKDQVGNIRTSFSDSNRDGHVDVVKQEKNYYPFGLQWQQLNSVIRGRKHNYGYGGKEEIKAFGLDWNDHGARMYDPAIAKWNGIDQLAEKYYGWSPYNYVAGNPILFTDPDGKDGIIHYMENGLEEVFIYKGGKPKNVPNNKFVRQTLSAIEYNRKNGGGQILDHLVGSRNLNVHIFNANQVNDPSSGKDKTYKNKSKVVRSTNSKEHSIEWDPNGGTLISSSDDQLDNTVISPATNLEHLAGEVVTIYAKEKNKDVKDPDKLRAAEHNGELKRGDTDKIRANPSATVKDVRTQGPTSRKPSDPNVRMQIQKAREKQLDLDKRQ
ncbi:RHS repeat domain-containing protein [Aquimarina sp. 2304DJ70-9]|uniref:RHS repeat domain-containing protein n=1 Tax=Aquimarina penaris TaxID=3231044 RepID=UPI0034627AE2